VFETHRLLGQHFAGKAVPSPMQSDAPQQGEANQQNERSGVPSVFTVMAIHRDLLSRSHLQVTGSV
jgi:hypothetical protein